MPTNVRTVLESDTLVQGGAGAGVSTESVFALTVTAGPDKGLSFTMNEENPSRLLLGTSPACELRLTDREVSRRHAAIERVPSGLTVTDLGSTNGTYVDRTRVIEAYLVGDEFIRMGSTMLRVDRVDGAHVAGPPEADGFGRMRGSSLEMRRLYRLCARLSASVVPLVIEGETGTGKEVLAEAIHEQGSRAAGPFVVFDCTTVPSNLVESELFGHERGAFTGAVAARRGVFEQAQGGTLLIDEIGDLDVSLQPKLLRAIERGEMRRVGGTSSIRVDARIIAATRRDLDREVQGERFRDDLFHRLAVGRIELPPLRHRRGDITMLAISFWNEFGGAAPGPPGELLRRWEDYAWPGNVRELRNAVARFIALGEVGDVGSAREATETNAPSDADPYDRVIDEGLPFPRARDRIMEEFEQRFVARLLERHGGDVASAAAASGIGRRYFQKLRARSVR